MIRDWLRRQRPARTRRMAPHAEWLEPRLLYSADGGALLLATADALQSTVADTRVLDAGYEYTAGTSAAPSAQEVRAAYALTPLQFEADAGQLGDGVDFAASGLGYAVRLGGGQAELLLAGADQPVRLELVGAGAGTAVGENPLATRSNYLVGQDTQQWVTDIANYGSVLYRGVYDGIDIRYYGTQDQLEYDFLLAPGADATQLQLRFHGTDSVSLDANGDLVLRVAGTDRELRFQAPVSYQEGSNGREAVESRYELQADGSVRIVVGAYDTSRALVVDPVLSHASYFGEAGAETALGVAVGADGSVYVTGQTTSTTGAFATRLANGNDANETYVARFNADLTTLVYATRVGGGSNEEGTSIAVDAGGNAVVTGWTTSNDFAGTSAASDQGSRSGTQDAFVFKLNAAGNALVFSTYFGGSGSTDAGRGVTLDASGNVYVVGTVSGTSDNAFLNKYDASGASQFKRQYGGSAADGAKGVALDASGNIYVAGNTLSDGNAIVGGAQATRGGADDGFLVKYDAGGTVRYATYIGGSNSDSVAGVAADDSGRAYVVGRTAKPSNGGFAATAGAFATTAYSHTTGYLRVYDTALTGASSLEYSSFVGGSKNASGNTSAQLNDAPTGVAVFGGQVAIVGTTDTADFPTTADAFSRTGSGSTGFVMVLKPLAGGSADLVYGSYYGAGLATGAVAWGNNRVYLVGSTSTTGLATPDGRTTITGSTDGLVASFGGFANSAPVLAGVSDLPAQQEDTATAGTLVSDLVAGAISDADARALQGIAVTAADGSNGTWQYSLNGGTTWATLADPGTGNALLLNADAQTRVRFVPSANYAGTASLTFRAWDRTQGFAGTTIAVPSTGGSTAFSDATASASVTVTPVNDAPVRTGGALASLTVTEGSGSVSLGLASLSYAAGPAGAADEAAQDLTFTVTALPGSAGSIVLADGTAVQVNGSYTLAQLQDMRLQPVRAGSGTFAFTVRDSGGTAGGGQDALLQSMTVTVTNVAPVLNGANPLATQLEDLPGNGTLVADLVAGRVTDPGGSYGIAVTAVPNGNIGGTWQYSTDGGANWLTLTGTTNGARLLAADSLTRVRFLSDAQWNGSVQGFSFRAWDRSSGTAGGTADASVTGGTSAFSSSTATASLTVTPVNDAPFRYNVSTSQVLPAPADVTVNEGSGLASLGLSYLQYIGGPAVDEYQQQTAGLAYTVTAVPGAAVGTVYLADGVTAVAPGVYTLAQLQGMVFRAAAGVQAGSGVLSWTVKDGGGTADGGVDTLAESITIRVQNVAPVLSGTNALPAVLEDTSGTGMRVLDLVSGKITDPSNALGIAVTAANSGNGNWEYSRDGGTTWSSLNGASATNAILLAGNAQTRVRFVPNANFNGTVTGLSFRAWDGSTGVAGGTADTTVNGGTTAFSSATATASITVTAVNDVPVRTAGTTSSLIILDGTPAISLGLGSVAYGPGGGTDEAGQGLTYTVTALPSALGTVLLANGNAVTLNGSYTLAQIQGMQFKSSGVGALGSAAFSFAVKDSGGTANGGVDTLVQSVWVIVNRAPVLNGANSPLTVYEDFDWSGSVPQGTLPVWASPAQRQGVLVSDIVNGQIVDTTGSLAGIAINAVSGNGSWQYTLDNGGTWTSIGAVSDASALLLAGDAQTRLRFLPSADFNGAIGTSGVTFRAWDRTTGSNGATADTTWNGGPSAYSAATATSFIAVTPVNDAPVRVAGTLSPVSAAEGSGTVSLGLGAIAYAPGPATATDEAAQALTYRVTVLPTALGDILLADGTTVVTAGAVYSLEQLRGMQFRPASGAMPGTASFGFEVQDNAGTANGGVDKLAQSLAITVTNQAPVLLGANAMAGMLEDTPDNGTLVSDIVAWQITDATPVRGIAVTGADATHGSWQYTTDGGTTWLALGAPTTGAARLLAADALTRLRFVPAADWNGTATLSFSAWDRTGGVAGGTADATIGGGTSAFSAASATTSVTVAPVNDAPVRIGAIAPLNVMEDSGSTSLGLSAVGYGPGGGADEATQALTYTVTALPPALLGAVTLADGTAVTTGTYTLQQLQGMRFVTAANASGSGSFSFTVKDDGGGADALAQTVAIGVAAVNDPPVRAAGTVANLTVAEDSGSTSLGLGSVAYAPGGGADEAAQGLGYYVTALPPSGLGRIVLADGTAVVLGSYSLADLRGMRFEAAADATGTGTFAFSVVDTGGGTDTLLQSLAIAVTPVNDRPVLVGAAAADLTVAEDSGTTSLGLGAVGYAPGGGSDEAAQVLTVTVTALPPASLGRIVLADGTAVGTGNYTVADLRGMQFVAAADASGTAVFGWSVVDNGGGTDTLVQALRITVTPVDDPSVLVADAQAVPEETSASGNVLANDADVDDVLSVASFQVAGDTATYAAGATATIAGVGTVTLGGDGSYVFTPLADWFGTAPLVSYTTGTGAGSTLAITVTPVDDASVVVPDSITVAEENPASGNVLANDTDVDDVLAVASFQVAGDGSTYAAGATATIAGVGTVTLGANGSYTFVPVANWNGSAPVVSYTTNTGAGSTLAISVTPVDDATLVAPDGATVAEDTPASGNVLANDSDVDDPLAVASFQVAGDASTYAAEATAIIAGKGSLALAADGSFTFTPLANWNGSAPVASYTTNTGAVSTLTMTVTPVDDATVAADDTDTTAEGLTATGNVLANDTDVDDTLTVASFRIAGDGTTYLAGASAATAAGTFTLAADGSYTFVPLPTWNGPVPLVSYTTGTGATATLAITVTPVDNATLAEADAVTVAEDTAALGNVLANDSDADDVLAVAGFRVAGDTASYAAGDTALIAGVGSLTVAADGGYAFTPLANWNGTVPVVSYTTNTGATSTLAIVVTPVDDATATTPDAAALPEDTVATGNVLANDSDVDNTLAVASFQVAGNPFTFGAGSTVAIAGQGTVTIAADGSYAFTPVANWNGSLPLVRYTTNTGATSTLAITLTPVDDPTVVTADTVAVAEDHNATGNVLANDSDVDDVLAVASFQVAGDTATHAAGSTATIAGVGSITLAVDGSFTFTPLADWNGSVPVLSYTTGTGATGTLAITVTPVNDATVVVSDSLTVPEDTVAAGNVLANDHDVDDTLAVTAFRVAGDTTTYIAGTTATIAGKGTVTVAADGSYAFTPAANWNGSVPAVAYRTNTGVTGTLAITVTAVNDPTNAAADSVAIAEDSVASGNVLANDSDVDDTLAVAGFQVAGDAASYAAGATAAIAGVGSITMSADGSFIFTPAANWNGSVPVVSYTTSTGAGSTLSIVAWAVDDASSVADDAIAVAEDTPASGNVLANDSDVDDTLAVASFQVAGDATVYTAGASAILAGQGTLTLGSDGSYSFTPAANWNGALAQVTYRTNTGASGALNITVDAVDDATVVAPDSVTVAEDNAAGGNVLANDSDVDDVLAVTSFRVAGDATSYAAGTTASIAGIGSITVAADGSFSFTPAANWNGSVPAVSYATDTRMTGALAITVTPVDDPTQAAADSVTVAEDSAASGNVLGNDGDVDDTLAVTAFRVAGDATAYVAGATVTIAGKGALTLRGDGSFTFTPVADWNGSVPVVSYTTNTGAGSTLAIRVTAVDDATVAVADAITVAEDSAAAGNVLANDTDVDNALAVSTFQVAGDTNLYAAGAAAMIAGVGSVSLAADGSFLFTPAANWSGSAPVVSYTTNTGATSTLAITVSPVDDPTVAVPDTISVAEDTSAAGNVLANDGDVDTPLSVASFHVAGDPVAYAAGSSVTIAGQGTLTLAANGAFSFSPVADWNGALPVVSYTTNTGATSTLGITVTPEDDATVAVSDSVAVTEDSAATGNVLANDSDADSVLALLTFRVTGDSTVYAAGDTATIAGSGTVTLAADGSYTFTPAADWNGNVPVVSYTTSTSATSTLTITVTAVDDATIAVADSAAVAEDNLAAGNVLANDSDVDSTVTVAGFTVAGDATLHAAGTTATIAGQGTLTIAANGSYTFVPVANWSGTVPLVSYTTNTGATSTLAITVAAVDDASVIVADAATVAEDTPAAGNVLANDSDVDSTLQVATFSVAGSLYAAGATATIAGVGSFDLAANGDYLFSPAADWNGSAPQVGYTVSTGASGTLDLTVTAVNDAPTRLSPAPADLTVAEGSGATALGLAGLAYGPGGGADEAGQVLAATVTALPDGVGRIVLADGVTDVVGGSSYTLAQLRGMQFIPGSGVSSGSGSFAFTVSDDAASPATLSERLLVTVVNQAPVLSGANPLAPILEDTTDAGMLVGDLIAGQASDPAGHYGIAVVAAATDAGQWQFTRDGGSSWHSFDGVSGSDAELLAADGQTRVRFVPNPDWNGDAGGLGFRAWDLSNGSTLRRADTSVNGGSSAFSAGVAMAGITVQPVDEAPPAAPSLAPPPVAQQPVTADAPPPAAPAAEPVASPAPSEPVLAAAQPAPAQAPSVVILPVTGRAAVDPLAGAGDGLVAGAAFTPAAAPLPGFAAPTMPLVQDPGHVQALTAITLRDIQLVGLGLNDAADFRVTGFAGVEGSISRITAEDFQQALRSGAFIEELNRLRKELHEDFNLDRSTSITVAGLSLGVSVVYVLWLIRGGVLLGSYLSALPAWRLLDPLPVLARAGDEEDDEDEEAFEPAGVQRPDPLRGFA